MYQYVSAIAKTKNKRTVWENVDLHLTTFEEILKTYSQVVFTLTNNFLTGNRYVTLRQMLNFGVRMDMTVEQWFGFIGNAFIQDSTTEPVLTYAYARFRDAWRAGYEIQYTNHAYHPSVNLPMGDRVDLLMSKPGVDSQTIYNNVLFTVNGLVHMTDFNANGVYVLEGGKSVQHANLNNVGVISFSEVAELQQIPILNSMINDADTGKPYSEGFYINTDIDMTNKTPLLVMGGYLHVLDDVYKVINYEKGIIKVYMKKINLMHRIFESRKLISLATMNLSTHVMNEGLITNSELYSNSVLASYATLPQSFIVLVDTPSLYVKKHLVESAELAGIYYTPNDPIYPLQLRTGILPEYWVREEDGVKVLSVTDSKARNYLFETTQWRNEFYTEETVDPVEPFYESKAFMLEIGKEVLTM